MSPQDSVSTYVLQGSVSKEVFVELVGHVRDWLLDANVGRIWVRLLLDLVGRRLLRKYKLSWKPRLQLRRRNLTKWHWHLTVLLIVLMRHHLVLCNSTLVVQWRLRLRLGYSILLLVVRRCCTVRCTDLWYHHELILIAWTILLCHISQLNWRLLIQWLMSVLLVHNVMRLLALNWWLLLLLLLLKV